jgi:hypothetical protein
MGGLHLKQISLFLKKNTPSKYGRIRAGGLRYIASCNAAYECVGLGQRTIYQSVAYRWRSGDYIKRLGSTLENYKAVVAVRCKVAYCPVDAVKLSQNKLK